MTIKVDSMEQNNITSKVTVEDSVENVLPKLAALASFTVLGPSSNTNPWTAEDIDRLEFNEDYSKTIKACRFFYRKDPIIASTINKLVEIGINEIVFSKNGGLSNNEFKVFTSLKNQLKEFAESMALEYLISGLVVPEIRYGRVPKNKLVALGIKNYDSLILPVSMFIRDPETIEIKKSPFADEPSYFLKIPDELIFFIKNKGKYTDGTSDPELYQKLLTYFGDFVKLVLKGTTKILLKDTETFIRRKPQPADPYPVPYLSPVLESLKHKRNLRRMDYAIATRVIGAIQLFKLGSDEFPVTVEDQDEQFGAIKEQMLWRNGTGKDVERIFQLFANHTLEVEWIVPDTAALLDEQKYGSVNQDIIYGLGFPRILITGESERTGTSDPQYAMMSPARTMENFREKIAEVVRYIVSEIAKQNNFRNPPEVKFKPLTLFDHQTLLKSLANLYDGGNISRTTYAETLGYNWQDETEQRKEEKERLEKLGLGEFAPKPFSNQPGADGQNPMDKNQMNKNTTMNPENNKPVEKPSEK